ncbi:hypothetical protein VCHE16_3734, partial [Vibrio paracholerae HE-16]
MGLRGGKLAAHGRQPDEVPFLPRDEAAYQNQSPYRHQSIPE